MLKAKKVTAILLCLMLMISLTACQTGSTEAPQTEVPQEEAMFTAGTYSASASGHNGNLTVEVTVDELEILGVAVVEHTETPGISDAAIERVPQSIVDNQSLAVDVISGATVTSNAIIAAASEALTSAGGDITALNVRKAAVAGETIEYTTDVVVIGGGGAGLAAAITAAENGSQVILIEKNAYLGGNTGASGGHMQSARPDLMAENYKYEMTDGLMSQLMEILDLDESDVGDFAPALVILQGQINEYLAGDTTYLFDSIELHMIQTYLGGKRIGLDGTEITSDYELVKTFAENAPKTLDWLVDNGMNLRESFRGAVGSVWPRTHGPQGGPFEIVQVLETMAQDLGVEMLLETTGMELIMDNGRVTGVLAQQNDGTEVVLMAKNGVVIAAGGYSFNPELIAEFNNYWPDSVSQRMSTNISSITGDGIAMGREIGANLVGMGYVQLMPVANPNKGGMNPGVYDSVDTYLWVNQSGVRFINEYEARDTLAKAALEQENGMYYMITDQEILAKYSDTDIENMIADKDIFVADTLEELAGLMDVDPDIFVAEIEKYNSYVDNGNDPDFGKPSFGGYKIDTAPFVATPRSPSIHHTMGGLEIDTLTRVISVDGQAIPGLYAAGEVVGGLHAGNRLGGNAVSDAITFGRIAGESVAKQR